MIIALRHLSGAVLVLLAPAFAAGPVQFSRDIEPLLRAKCYGCHGPSVQMQNLRLDQEQSARRVLNATLLERVTHSDPRKRMPPAGALPEAEVDVLRRWIEERAPWSGASSRTMHWSFQPLRRPSGSVDGFILAKLRDQRLEPQPEADRVTLIRRLSFDLIGLPPSPEEVSAFVADTRTDTYERVVDRLLHSPHYGERWARHWLDLARYADSDGYEKDMFRPNAWRWRDWVIEALNSGMPFDQFTLEQIAGDLLPDATTGQRVATGFHRNSLKNREAGVNRAEARFEETVDRTNTVATVWLGLTAGCAQCHDHKYDAISQRDYYRLFAFFNDSEDAEMDAPLAGEWDAYQRARSGWEQKRRALLDAADVPAAQARWEARMLEAMAKPGEDVEWDYWLTELRARIDYSDRMLREGLAGRSERDKRTIENYFVANPGPFVLNDKAALARLEQLRADLRPLNDAAPVLSQANVLIAPRAAEPTYVAIRGDYRQRGARVEAGIPELFGALPASNEPARLRLARWLVSRNNPLTSRVVVNRIWQEFFGAGLVRTPEDFGIRGEAPTHPELLDWLAAEFVESGWNLRHIQKQIVTSAAYRRSSNSTGLLREKDPENRLLARQSRFRLSAEQIRDASLAVSGLLHAVIGGKSVRPPQPESVSKVTYSRGATWNETPAPGRYRRGLYIHYQRTSPYPQLVNFDAPDSNTACTLRRRSNSPLQALNLLNDPVFFEAAQALAARAPDLRQLFRAALSREAKPEELERMMVFRDAQRAIFERNPEASGKVAATPAQAAMVAVARALMNTDEFLTRE
ncbi:MAG: PSD1 and planctomycete cytochrome C domain-containing protein [Bryobacteraceae bacterium]